MTLPNRPDALQCAGYVANIVGTYHRASIDQLARGRDWYPLAHAIAADMGDVIKGAGLLAALSPQKEWSQNVKLAREVYAGKRSGHFTDAIRKCDRIMAGEAPELVLPMGAKTGQFYLCILDPADPDAVVIDRHAHDIAAGKKYGWDMPPRYINGRRYQSLVTAYREAAKIIGESPSTVQAVSWTVHVDESQWKRPTRESE